MYLTKVLCIFHSFSPEKDRAIIYYGGLMAYYSKFTAIHIFALRSDRISTPLSLLQSCHEERCFLEDLTNYCKRQQNRLKKHQYFHTLFYWYKRKNTWRQPEYNIYRIRRFGIVRAQFISVGLFIYWSFCANVRFSDFQTENWMKKNNIT